MDNVSLALRLFIAFTGIMWLRMESKILKGSKGGEMLS
jgi:hypothetical protein